MAEAPQKPRKRDPTEERPLVRDDSQEALTRLLTPNEIASLKAEFDAAHKEGMDALKRRDYRVLRHAINRERNVIDAIVRACKPAPKPST